MKITSNETMKTATLTLEAGDDMRATVERIHNAALLIAKGVTTQEIGNSIVVSWEPWPESKEKTDMTGFELLDFVAKESKVEKAEYDAKIEAKLIERKKVKR